MDENNPLPKPDGFQTKQVGDLTLDAATKDRIVTPSASVLPPRSPDKPLGSGSPGFVSNNKWYIIAGLAALSVIGFLAFMVFRPASEPKEANILMEIQAPDEIPGNGETVFKIKVENKDSETLVRPELELIYPDGFTFITSTPQAENVGGTSFVLGDISPGQAPVVLIKLRPEGGVGETKKIVARLRYRLASFSSEFVKETEKQSKVVAAGMILELEGPSETNTTQPVTYTLTYINSADIEFKNGRIEFILPSGFSVAGSDPAPSIGKNVWNVASVPSGARGTIRINGSFSSATPGETQVMKAVFSSQDNSGAFRKQAEQTFDTHISSAPLVARLELARKNGEVVVNPGELLDYKVSYQNNAAKPARSVIIVVTLSSNALDLASIKAKGAQVEGNTITWNAASSQALEVVSPGGKGELEFSVKVNNPPVKDSSTNVGITSSVKIKSNEFDTFLPGSELQLKVSSIASLSSGVEFVTGALPPRVGNESTYRITLSLKNLTNEFSGCVVTGFVAVSTSGFDTSSFQPFTESSKASFDGKSGKLTWNVGQLRAHTGDFTAPRTLSFNVRVTPAPSNEGREMVLFKTITATCQDTFTSKEVRLTANDIATDDLPGNDGNQKGRVVE